MIGRDVFLRWIPDLRLAARALSGMTVVGVIGYLFVMAFAYSPPLSGPPRDFTSSLT
ncbi:hypothetical protein PUV47_19670 [Pseudovibrio exalbescens]|uniref:hypothetical protein n=1 Tax=Pseudovibrio exalbescens TaxID=197461 RepID=UPI002365C371|nr:hypothetical protein [Pseudovibrio exalbescens]MDD7912155.1 hypothetical protein [Pseudovibrio exalbescens]